MRTPLHQNFCHKKLCSSEKSNLWFFETFWLFCPGFLGSIKTSDQTNRFCTSGYAQLCLKKLWFSEILTYWFVDRFLVFLDNYPAISDIICLRNTICCRKLTYEICYAKFLREKKYGIRTSEMWKFWQKPDFGNLLYLIGHDLLLEEKIYGFQKVNFMNFDRFSESFWIFLKTTNQIWDENFNRKKRLRELFLQKRLLPNFLQEKGYVFGKIPKSQKGISSRITITNSENIKHVRPAWAGH